MKVKKAISKQNNDNNNKKYFSRQSGRVIDPKNMKKSQLILEKQNKQIVENKNKLEDNKEDKKMEEFEKKQLRLLNNISMQEKLRNVYKDAEKEYEIQSGRELMKYNMSKQDKEWMKRIIRSGTFKDKVSALSIYIQDNPKYSLKTLNSLIVMCEEKKSKKDQLIVFTALKDLFLKVYKMEMNVFQKGLQETEVISKEKLVEIYYEDQLKKHYRQYIEIGRRLLMDELGFVKEGIARILMELLRTEPDQNEGENILGILVNKLGDKDKQFVKWLGSELAKLIAYKKQLQQKLVLQLMSFVFRPNIHFHTQYYAINLINSLSQLPSQTLLTLLKFYFALFSKIISNHQSTDDLIASKMLSQILRGINHIFPQIQSNKSSTQQFKTFFDLQVDNLYKIVHITKNYKIKIQTLLFIFQVQSQYYQLNDRFYNILYSMLYDKQIQNTTLVELFFDLLFFSLKADFNIKRVKAFVKRLLQVAIHSNVGFIVTSILFISNLMQVHQFLSSMFTFTEKNFQDEVKSITISKDQNDNNNFDYNFNDNEEKHKLKESNLNHTNYNQNNNHNIELEENNCNNNQNYDFMKKQPQFSNADNTCLWEINVLQNHYHPSVQKFSQELIEKLSNQTIQYSGNPILDFSLINFLERFSLKKCKQLSKSQLQKVTKNKLRRSKVEDSLSINNVINKEQNQVREDERFFLKYFQQKQKRVKNKKQIKKQLGLDYDDEIDQDDFADQLIDQEMEKFEITQKKQQKYNQNFNEEFQEENSELEEFLNQDLQDEFSDEDQNKSLDEENEFFNEKQIMEDIFDIDEENELQYDINNKSFTKKSKKSIKIKKQSKKKN